jgi:hypothetical protein
VARAVIAIEADGCPVHEDGSVTFEPPVSLNALHIRNVRWWEVAKTNSMTATGAKRTFPDVGSWPLADRPFSGSGQAEADIHLSTCTVFYLSRGANLQNPTANRERRSSGAGGFLPIGSTISECLWLTYVGRH